MPKIAIIGGRDYTDAMEFKRIMSNYIFGIWKPIDHVKMKNKIIIVSGGCPTGIDKMAKDMALECVYAYDYKEFPANWEKYGNPAGPIRNKEIVQYADIMVAFWDRRSKGTKNAISTMLKANKPVFIFPY